MQVIISPAIITGGTIISIKNGIPISNSPTTINALPIFFSFSYFQPSFNKYVPEIEGKPDKLKKQIYFQVR